MGGSHDRPSYGPVNVLLSQTGQVLAGSVTAAVQPNAEVPATPTLTPDLKGYGTLVLRTYEDFKARLYRATSTPTNVPYFYSTWSGSLVRTGGSGQQTSAEVYSDVSRFSIKPCLADFRITNGGKTKMRFRAYIIRLKRFNSAYINPLDYASAAFEAFQTNWSSATGSGPQDAQDALSPLMPHVSFVRSPHFHRWFEVVAESSGTLAHGCSAHRRIVMPAATWTMFDAYLDGVAVEDHPTTNDLTGIPGVTLTQVVECDWDPVVTCTATTPTFEVAQEAGIAEYTWRWTEKVSMRPVVGGVSSTNYVAPAEFTIPAPQYGSGAAGISSVMNEFGTAATNQNYAV